MREASLDNYGGIQRLEQVQLQLEDNLGNVDKFHRCALLVFEQICNLLSIDNACYQQTQQMELRQTKRLDEMTIKHLGSLSKSQITGMGLGAATALTYIAAALTGTRAFEMGAQAGNAAGQITSPISNTHTSYYQAENKKASEKLRSDQQNISSVKQELEKTLRQQQEASDKRSRIAGA